jgi:hypothetical protein
MINWEAFQHDGGILLGGVALGWLLARAWDRWMR